MSYSRSAAVEDVLRDIDQMNAIAEGIRARTAGVRKELDKVNRGVEQQRREGKLGPEWRILQQRIDLNQTTFHDIMTGMDRSREARAVRERISDGLPAVKAAFDQAVREDSGGAYAELQTALDDLDPDLRGWGV
jgi:hypothetical protein